MGYHHILPTREFMIALVRQRGAKAAFGPHWPHSKAKTIAELSRLTESEFMRRCGCDHCDNAGNCLGHTDDDDADVTEQPGA